VAIRVLFRCGIVATIADVVTTFVALRLYVGMYEGNPIAARVIESVGLEGMLLLRLAVGAGVCIVAVRFLTYWRAQVALLFAAAFWTLVAASNVYEIAKFS
jgi:hypothetical protein